MKLEDLYLLSVDLKKSTWWFNSKYSIEVNLGSKDFEDLHFEIQQKMFKVVPKDDTDTKKLKEYFVTLNEIKFNVRRNNG